MLKVNDIRAFLFSIQVLRGIIKNAVNLVDDSIFCRGIYPYFVVNPFSRASLRQAVMPFLLMVRIASADTFNDTHLSSSGM